MNRASLNFTVDILSLLAFVLMLLTGFILWGPLPPGTNKDLSLWGMTRHQWGDVHLWGSLGLVALLVGHISLHWRWILAMIDKNRAQNSKAVILLGLGIAAVVLFALAVFAWVTMESVEKIDRRRSALHTGLLPT